MWPTLTPQSTITLEKKNRLETRMTAMTQLLFRAAILLSTVCAASVAAAQSSEAYPNRPLRFIVGFGPGGSTDLLSRTLANFLAEKLGQRWSPT